MGDFCLQNVHAEQVIYDPEGGTPQRFWCGCAAPTLKHLSSWFQTEICNCPYTISDLSQKSIPHFRPPNLLHDSNI